MKKLLVLLSLNFGLLTLNSQTPQDWQVSGITTIQGTINNFEKYYSEHNSIEIQVDDWTNAYRRKYFTKINEDGKFSLSFFVFNQQTVLFTYKNRWPSVIVSPNDTLELIINAETFPSGIKYFGKTAKSCEDLNQFLKSDNQIFTITNSKIYFDLSKTLTFDKYKAWRDSVYIIEQKNLKEYLLQDSLDPYFSNWLKSSSKLRYQADIFRYNPMLYSINKPINHDTVINTLFKIIKSVDLDTSEYLTTNSGSYFSLINSMHISIKQIAYDKYDKERRKASPLSQSKEPEKNYTTSNQLTEEESTKAMFPYFLKVANLLITNNQIKESVIAHTHTMTLESRNIDLGLDSTLAHISNPNIKASLINEYNSHKWRTLDQNSLKINNETDSLLNYLRNKYKGEVQYINFWSTLFGDCFRNTPEIIKRFEGQKVAFIYLCCNSDKTKWEQVIKEYKIGGEHIFLTSEQYMSLAKIFNIMTVPRYIIIDKNGRIVNENAPQPGPIPFLQDILVKELTKYLNK